MSYVFLSLLDVIIYFLKVVLRSFILFKEFWIKDYNIFIGPTPV